MMLRTAAVIAAIYGTASAFAPVAFVPRSSNVAIAQSNTALSMVSIDTSDIKNGLTIELDGDPYRVLSFSIMKQARGAAKMTIKMKNLIRGTTLENTYRSGEKFETALVEKKPAQFTYADVCVFVEKYFIRFTTFIYTFHLDLIMSLLLLSTRYPLCTSCR